MFSRLRAFRGGVPAWAVAHDPDVDRNGMATEGEPPPAVQDIRAALAAEWGADEGVDYMFDVPVRLGQQLCGYVHDDLHPVVWTVLERSGRRREADAPPRLPEAFKAELLPSLQASGWSLAAQDPHFSGGAWDVTRVVEGRRQLLAFGWREQGPDLWFEIGFVVRDGARWTDQALLAGEVRAVRTGDRPAGKSLWRRIADRFRSGAAEPPAPPAPLPDPVAELVARIKEDLTAVEAFLATGDQD